MVVVRSPHAHADIDAIDTAAACALPGVVAILTGADLNGEIGVIHTHVRAQAFDTMNPQGRARAAPCGTSAPASSPDVSTPTLFDREPLRPVTSVTVSVTV